jgi:Flp pilus assembly protein TadD
MLLLIVWRASMVGDPMRRLQRAVAQTSTRSVEGRIVAFRHARFHAPRSEASAIDPAVRIEAERVVRLTDDHASTLHARGVASLVLGRDRDAITLLESAARLAPQNASYWSDLSAALMTNQSQAALAAADRAIAIDPSLPAAHFNRGLALERLGLAGLASEEYRRSSAFDADSEWAAEARRRHESIAR